MPLLGREWAVRAPGPRLPRAGPAAPAGKPSTETAGRADEASNQRVRRDTYDEEPTGRAASGHRWSENLQGGRTRLG